MLLSYLTEGSRDFDFETEEDFIKHHKTGHINSWAYADDDEVENYSWLGKPEKYPLLLASKDVGGKRIEFRQSGKPLKYAHKDDKGDYRRDVSGNLIYYTDDDMEKEQLPKVDTLVVAFDGETPVGFISNEWGATGVWVAAPYRRLRIASTLMDLFLPQFARPRRLGQMTPSGEEFARAYYRQQRARGSTS